MKSCSLKVEVMVKRIFLLKMNIIEVDHLKGSGVGDTFFSYGGHLFEEQQRLQRCESMNRKDIL